MTKTLLKCLFVCIFACMIAVTVHASRQIALWDAWDHFAANPWAVATLWDAYFGFLFFTLWVFYREKSTGARILWFVLIFCLGNIAMSFYAFLQVMRLRPDEPAEALLGRRA